MTKKLKFFTYFKCLGVTLDYKLTFNQQEKEFILFDYADVSYNNANEDVFDMLQMTTTSLFKVLSQVTSININ